MGGLEREAAFWDRAAEKYAARPVADEEAYAQTLQRVRAHLKPGDRVLEVGCGTGTTALKLADAAGAILATDVSSAMIEIAEKKRAEALARNVVFKVGAISDASLDGEAFDVVAAFNLFHLLDDPAAAMRRAHALLKPGGLMISKTSCLAGRAWLLGPLIGVMRFLGRAPKVRFFSVAEYDAMIDGAGFEIVETGYFPVSSSARFVVARKRA